MITLRIHRNVEGDPAGVSFEQQVPGLSSASDVINGYRHADQAVTATATDADGTFRGTALAGGGEVHMNWA